MSLTVQYFRSQDSIGERSTCIVTGFTYLLLAMIILIVDENTLEVGLDRAYSSFNASASQFLEVQGISSSGPASKIIVKFTIAVTCGLLGAMFTFPGLRMARMHWDSLKYCDTNRFLKVLLNISFALPFILVILWIKPISRDYLTSRTFSGMDQPLLSSDAFDTIRLGLVIVAVVLRIALMPIYLQAYLNLAYHRLEEQKKEAGRITNIELQKKISSIFYYLCVVTLQYVAPILMCLFLALMYKTLGGYEWTAPFKAHNVTDECSALEGLDSPVSQVLMPEGVISSSSSDSEGQAEVIVEGILDTAKTLQLSWQNVKNIFTRDVYRGIFGFATWWSCFLWFAASSLGMLYQSYFVK